MKYAWILPVFLLIASPALATFIMPENVPVGRLARNVGAYAKAHPDDPHGWYVLGRIHSLALTLGATELGVYGSEADGELPTIDHQFHQENEGEKPSVETLRLHLDAALAAFGTSLALEPRNARTILGVAYTLEAGASVARTLPPGDAPEPPTAEDRQRYETLVERLGDEAESRRDAAEKALVAAGRRAWPALASRRDDPDPERRLRIGRLVALLWTDAAIARYRRAFDLAVSDDLARPHLPLQGLTQVVSYEAGTSWLRLVEARGLKPWQRTTAARIYKQVRSLGLKSRGIITPIIFPLDRPRSLASLLERDHRADFDLDGDLTVESWPWVKEDTGILVWDPEAKGRITSGRQLFGSATWWMLWRDGYQALDALDDDRDGVVRGDELAGLAVWRDANGDGTSDPGEVIPAARLGVSALHTRPLLRGSDGPAHPAGLELADGRVLPTYDWTLPASAGR